MSKENTINGTSREIQDEFAVRYAKYSYNKDNWQVQPEQIGHVFMDWFSAWLQENNGKKLGMDYTYSQHPELVVRKMFGKFFRNIKERNHVIVPHNTREAAIKEYLED